MKYYILIIIAAFGLAAYNNITIDSESEVHDITGSIFTSEEVVEAAAEATGFIELVTLADDAAQKYIERFDETAVREMNKYNIPASISLAQGLLESNAGQSRLALKYNNHFGVKCFSKHCKKGHCANHKDDTHKDFFRIYPNAWHSWRAHSILLQKERYASCYESNGYREWAYSLKKCGYATDPKYAEKIIGIINKYKLYKFDKN